MTDVLARMHDGLQSTQTNACVFGDSPKFMNHDKSNLKSFWILVFYISS